MSAAFFAIGSLAITFLVAIGGLWLVAREWARENGWSDPDPPWRWRV